MNLGLASRSQNPRGGGGPSSEPQWGYFGKFSTSGGYSDNTLLWPSVLLINNYSPCQLVLDNRSFSFCLFGRDYWEHNWHVFCQLFPKRNLLYTPEWCLSSICPTNETPISASLPVFRSVYYFNRIKHIVHNWNWSRSINTCNSSLHLRSSSNVILFSCFLKYLRLAACKLNQVYEKDLTWGRRASINGWNSSCSQNFENSINILRWKSYQKILPSLPLPLHCRKDNPNISRFFNIKKSRSLCALSRKNYFDSLPLELLTLINTNSIYKMNVIVKTSIPGAYSPVCFVVSKWCNCRYSWRRLFAELVVTTTFLLISSFDTILERREEGVALFMQHLFTTLWLYEYIV